jgi:hypothetical protein
MRKSRLEPHAAWIIGQLEAGLPVSRILGKLKEERDCHVVLPTLQKWIGQQKLGDRVKLRRRGRPPVVSRGGLDFIPNDQDAGVKPVSVPLFIFALLKPRALESFRWYALAQIGIEGAGVGGIATWAASLGKDRVARLSDTDFCLIACLKKDGPIPFGKDPDEIESWFRSLLNDAAEIKALVRQNARK